MSVKHWVGERDTMGAEEVLEPISAGLPLRTLEGKEIDFLEIRIGWLGLQPGVVARKVGSDMELGPSRTSLRMTVERKGFVASMSGSMGNVNQDCRGHGLCDRSSALTTSTEFVAKCEGDHAPIVATATAGVVFHERVDRSDRALLFQTVLDALNSSQDKRGFTHRRVVVAHTGTSGAIGGCDATLFTGHDEIMTRRNSRSETDSVQD
jgi:hypothetical protein